MGVVDVVEVREVSHGLLMESIIYIYMYIYISVLLIVLLGTTSGELVSSPIRSSDNPLRSADQSSEKGRPAALIQST